MAILAGTVKHETCAQACNSGCICTPFSFCTLSFCTIQRCYPPLSALRISQSIAEKQSLLLDNAAL